MFVGWWEGGDLERGERCEVLWVWELEGGVGIVVIMVKSKVKIIVLCFLCDVVGNLVRFRVIILMILCGSLRFWGELEVGVFLRLFFLLFWDFGW